MSIAELKSGGGRSRLAELVTDRLGQNEPDRSNGLAMRLEEVSAWYGTRRRSMLRRGDPPVHLAVEAITLPIEAKKVTAIIGPSGCGKSTLLRSLNRLHGEGKPEDGISGMITMIVGENEHNILSPDTDTTALRREVGMVFQKPNPFPNMSISENAVAGLKLSDTEKSRKERDKIAERVLTQVGLWDEVKDKLGQPGTSLSGGQQQRLCIARALAVEPKVLLMDEPCSSLDPIATGKIEELITKLKNDGYTIVIVTHNLEQAARVSDYTAFLNIDRPGGPGKLIEYAPTGEFFTKPQIRGTIDYITGRFG